MANAIKPFLPRRIRSPTNPRLSTPGNDHSACARALSNGAPTCYITGRGAEERIAGHARDRLCRVERSGQDDAHRQAYPRAQPQGLERLDDQTRPPQFRPRPAGQGFLRASRRGRGGSGGGFRQSRRPDAGIARSARAVAATSFCACSSPSILSWSKASSAILCPRSRSFAPPTASRRFTPMTRTSSR